MTTVVTTSTPVKWNRKEFNLGIVYNNGIITIDEPGYYRSDTKNIYMHNLSINKVLSILANNS